MDANELEKLTETLEKIYGYLRTEMINELLQQGHSNTGKLIDSIDREIVQSTDYIQLNGTFVFYGKYVDTGRRAGARKVPIFVLEEWIKQKGIESDIKKVKGLAFAIQKTIFDKGISTPASWKGESTKDWMTKTLKENDPQIKDDVFNAVRTAMELIIFNIVRDTNVSIQGNTTNLFAA